MYDRGFGHFRTADVPLFKGKIYFEIYVQHNNRQTHMLKWNEMKVQKTFFYAYLWNFCYMLYCST